jgi:hypothetical protein
MKTIAAGLALLLLLFLVPDDSLAGSETCSNDFWGNCGSRHTRHAGHNGYNGHNGYQGFRYRHCSKDFWGRCADGRPRWRRNDDNGHGHHHHHGHGHGHRFGHIHYGRFDRDDVDHGAFCHHRRRVVGEERTSKAKARRAADDAWMGAVRYDHGERFQDLNHAKDVRHNCDPSSTTAILKRTYFRCVVEATPCRGPTGSSDERYERRYEEEEGDDKD